MIEWVPWAERAARKRSGPHRLTGRVLHWPYCTNCGLLALKNDATRRLLKRRCEWWEDA